MKKKIIYTLFALTLVIVACSNAQQEEKELQKSVLDSHEKVMGDDEKAMINKMKLDTLIQKADSLKLDKKAAVELSTKLTYADNRMGDWMAKINLDNSGKNHADIIKYWHGQQALVKQIDSLLVSATAESTAYIQNTLKK